MNAPKIVKVLWREILLKPFSRDEVLGAKVMGRAHYVEGIIRYHVSEDEAETADTIIHELLHHLDNQIGIIPDKLTNEESEDIIRKFASGLTTVMKDNHEFFDILQAMIATGRGMDRNDR